ncbi:MAG: bacteriochlorophyll 4-vinyl reductase [Pseudomonadota bacterium]
MVSYAQTPRPQRKTVQEVYRSPRAPKQQAKIGPYSILHLVPILDETLGIPERGTLLRAAGINELPSGQTLAEESMAASLHQLLRQHYPAQARSIVEVAGRQTGEHIIASRMPEAARLVLERLPQWLAAPLLAKIIKDYAWTFSGSGQVEIVSRAPVVIDIRDNPVVRGEKANAPVCAWHASVFEQLFRKIISDDHRCEETLCCAKGDPVCRFHIYQSSS